MTVNQHARGHALHFIELSQLSLGIEAHVKRWVKLIQEFIRIGSVPIQIDGNYPEPLSFVGALHRLHPRKRLSARSAPRCPEIYINNAATQTGEIQRRGGVSRYHEHETNAHENASHHPGLTPSRSPNRRVLCT